MDSDAIPILELFTALENGNKRRLKVLLGSGNFNLNELLANIATERNSESLMESLIDFGAEINRDVIRSAVLGTEVGNLKFLLDNGGEVDEELLADAVGTRKAGIVKVLMAYGADPTVKVNGESAIERAKRDKQWHLVKILSGEWQKAQMPRRRIAHFDDQVKVATDDLCTYPASQLKLMAKSMGISPKKSKMQICKEIARKNIFVHSKQLPEVDRTKCARYSKKMSPEQIEGIRAQLYDEFQEFKDSVYMMQPPDLRRLLDRYDELYFEGDLNKHLKNVSYKLEFKTSGEATFTTEGICNHKTCDYTITILTKPFKKVRGVTIVAGHKCNDQMECLLRVIEHEMLHLIIFIFCSDSFITDQHGPLFMNMAKDLFGHTDHRHHIF